jgi:hypothetical protein
MKKLYILLAMVLVTSFTFAQRGTVKGVELTNKQINISKTPTDTLLPGNFANATGLSIYSINGAAGYVAGSNEFNDAVKAQQFIVTPSTGYAIEGASFWFAAKDKAGTPNDVTFRVWDMDGTTGETFSGSNQTCPNTVLGSTTLSVDDIDTVNETYVTFPTPIIVTSDYAIGIDIENTYDDTVALITTKDGDGGGFELAWEKWSNGSWYTMMAAWGDGTTGIDFDLCIFPIVDMSSANITDNYYVFGMKMTTYPNPARNEATLAYELENNSDNVVVTIVNERGRLVRTIEQGAQNKGSYTLNLDLSDLASGNYFCNLSSNGQRLIKRMVIVK